jgi:hypothetical protein
MKGSHAMRNPRKSQHKKSEQKNQAKRIGRMSLSNFIQTHSKHVIMALFVVGFAAVGTTLLVMSRAAVAVNSVQSGPWGSPSTWSGGHVPEAGDTITITNGHTVTYDVTSGPVLGEMQVKGTLTFDPARSAKLTTERNIVVHGQLVMKPASPTVEHFIQFVNVREQDFVGGGMQVLASDVGLWVMDERDAQNNILASGQLDIAGTTKTSWTNATDGLSAGATSVTLKESPAGWRVGDTIIITPTEAPTAGRVSYDAIEERVITGISGNTVTFNSGLSRSHPKVNNMWTAEVGNLTRNVRIEGTRNTVDTSGIDNDALDAPRHTGNSHIFIHSQRPQQIHHAQLRYMGTVGADESRSDVMSNAKLGRYSLHFHHNGKGSIGSVVDGVVVRNANFHQFVPHASHGITMKNNIAYDNKSGAFWWDQHDIDPNSDSHQTVWDHNLVAKMRPRGDFGHSLGFFLPAGFDNKAINNTYVGATGLNEDYGGYVWINGNVGVWVFDGNVAHNNNSSAVRVWQNSSHIHPITNFAFYHNKYFGMNHGAYVNDYNYVNGHVYGNERGGLMSHANSNSAVLQRYENVVWDGAGITPSLIIAAESQLFHGQPTLFRGNTFQNYKDHAILVENTGDDPSLPKKFDIVDSTFHGSSPIFYGQGSDNTENIIRVQPQSGQPYQIASGNVRTNISAFAPTQHYGTGTGLLAEYFRGGTISEDNKIYSRLEPTVSNEFAEDDHIPPPWLEPWEPTTFMMRWTGEFVPQESDSYVFTAEEFFRTRVWLDDQLVLDASNSHRERVAGAPVTLTAGKRYKIRVEGNFPDTGNNKFYVFSLFMRKASEPASANRVLPRSQLYCGTDPACNPNFTSIPSTPAPEPPPTPPVDTTAPTVSITAPANNTTITGSVNVTANASDNVAVTQVEFLVNGQSRNTDTAAPYTYSLSSTALGLASGNHTVTVRARDAAGNTTTSSPITITISPPPAPEPEPEPEPTPISPEDVDGNGVIDLRDFSLFRSRFRRTSNFGRADIDKNGVVDLRDFSLLRAKFIK